MEGQKENDLIPEQHRGNNFRRTSVGLRFKKSERKCHSCQNTGHFVKDCPTRYCQPVETKAMIPGIGLAHSTNDYMDLVRIPYQNQLTISQPFYA